MARDVEAQLKALEGPAKEDVAKSANGAKRLSDVLAKIANAGSA